MNGLANESFACYMNVVFQTVAHLPGLREYFLSGQHLVDTSGSGKQEDDELLCDHMAMFYKCYHSITGQVIDPVELKFFLSKKCSTFNLQTQEDSHEFMLFLLNLLSEELNKSAFVSPSAKKPRTFVQNARSRRSPIKLPIEAAASVEGTAKKLWDEELKKCTSICTDLLLGQMMSEVECTTCHKINRIFQVFYVLELPLPEKKEASLAECLQDFAKEESIGLEEGWKCDTCKTERQAKKRSVITRLPKVLMVYFKRFLFSDKAFVRSKCRVSLQPTGERVPLNEGAYQEYTVFSVTVGSSHQHHRGSLHNGHYTASLFLGEQSFLFDDESVGPTTLACTEADCFVTLVSKGLSEVPSINSAQGEHRPQKSSRIELQDKTSNK